jgi:hypothetical protein
VLQGLAAATGGRLDDAIRVWTQFVATYPSDKDVPAVREGLDAAERFRRALEVVRGD